MEMQGTAHVYSWSSSSLIIIESNSSLSDTRLGVGKLYNIMTGHRWESMFSTCYLANHIITRLESLMLQKDIVTEAIHVKNTDE